MLKRVQLSIQPDHIKDLGDGVVEVVVATGNTDWHGEKINIDGIKTNKYNGVVLWGHDYNSLPIGKSMGMKKQDGKLISKTQFAIGQYQFAKTVYDMVKAGFIPDVSIGFIPEEWDSETDTWSKSSIIEYSHVTIGANPEAKVTAKALGLDIDRIEAEEKQYLTLKQPIAKDHELSNNDEVIALLSTMKFAVGDIETQVKQLTELTHKLSQGQPEQTTSKRQVKKRLVLAKKSAKSVDRVAETLIRAINTQLSHQ